jgi:hypothetical protein
VSDVVADDAKLGVLNEGVRGYALDAENAKGALEEERRIGWRSLRVNREENRPVPRHVRGPVVWPDLVQLALFIQHG